MYKIGAKNLQNLGLGVIVCGPSPILRSSRERKVWPSFLLSVLMLPRVASYSQLYTSLLPFLSCVL